MGNKQPFNRRRNYIMASQIRKVQTGVGGPNGTQIPKTSAELDKAEGWIILRRFKTKVALAAYANDPSELADLEFKYPLRNYRRKLDLHNLYVAVLHR